MTIPLHNTIKCLLLIALLISPFAMGKPANAENNEKYKSAARHAILIDSLSGKILYEKDADTLMPPASMSKIMTMLMVFERLKDKRLRLDDEFTISENAWRKGGASSGGSTMYAKLHSRVKLDDLIHGVIIQSANDACIAIAEGIAGSEQQFAALMTKRAHELGLQNSTFKNATGLPDPEHRTTARELAMMSRYLIEVFPEYYEIYSQLKFTWNNISQNNRNPLLYGYDGADGIKTGYTKESGYGLVGSAKRNGRRLILVINGLPSKRARQEESARLMDYGFRQFHPIDLYAPQEPIASARVWGGKQSSVPLISKTTITASLKPEERKHATTDIIYTAPLKAPINTGEQVALLRLLVDGKVISKYPLFTSEPIAIDTRLWSNALDSLTFMLLGG